MGGNLGGECSANAEAENVHMHNVENNDDDPMRITDSNVKKVKLHNTNDNLNEDVPDLELKFTPSAADNGDSEWMVAQQSLGSVSDTASGSSSVAAAKSQLLHIEEEVRSFAVKYRKVSTNRSDMSSETRLVFEDKIFTISDEMRRLTRGVSVSTTESSLMQTSYLGLRTRRFKSLRDVVRKVMTDMRIKRILAQWTQLASPRKTSDLKQESMEFDPLITKSQMDVWDGVDVLDLDKKCSEPLFQVFMSVWYSQKMSLLVKAKAHKVHDYVRAVEAGYHRQNPYHNNAHAAEVTLMTYQIWSYLSAGSFKGYFEQIDLLVVLLAAAIHDIGHPATNNDFLVKTKAELAIRYHDTAVLENFHLATAFELMRSRSISMLDHNLPSPPVTSLRRRIVEIVLATDMAVHKKQVDDMARLVERNMNRQEIDKRALEQYIVHTADVGHPFRPVPQHHEWARRVNAEFLQQGDREKELGFTPIEMFDREKAPPLPKNQLGFLQFVIQPLWKPMEALLDTKARPASLFLQRNVKVWEDELAAETPTSDG